MSAVPTPATDQLRAARDLLLQYRDDRDQAVERFRWPRPTTFNWGVEWFDVIATEHPDRPALVIVEPDGSVGSWTYGQLARRTDQVAGWLRANGVQRGDRIVLMLGNQVELWEIVLAAIKIGAVIIPASTLLTPDDLADRVGRGGARFVVARDVDTDGFRHVPGVFVRIAVGRPVDGWIEYEDSAAYPDEGFVPEGVSRAGDPLLLYFTSGTTALPKLVEHTQISYPIGHLSTMYWIGLRPGDVHLNISSPGWAKHAWSCVFAPWLAQATVLVFNYARFDAVELMRVLDEQRVNTFCAPPTVWRMLIQADLSRLTTPPRELVGAGEPLNPEVIEQVQRAWGVTIRDGFGQTEMTLAVGNAPGQPVRPGSMGRPMPGYRVELLDPSTGAPGEEGELCVDLSAGTVGLLAGYHGEPKRTAEATRGGYYHTGDLASRDADGYLTYVGRDDDVFKASDYRISPFAVESVLLEHPAVAEAAVVPSPDPLRLAVPKAYVVLAEGYHPNKVAARLIFEHSRDRLAPYQRIRRLEFGPLPKTISGKIRRVELRGQEQQRHGAGGAGQSAAEAGIEYRVEDFPELR
ncbi:AMP-binding protein [Nakamurella multipartita]|uniref:AMP-dependent synthetase and ligase n=1 Tax=Nakamurella multipartita (strain ATCC 700099 / DSM 44233 / CIP 104796 / JCM 9543 / NBRC 105858 / Y-104) TaxID=479431 RepID=C8X8D9_NAKMY|nr:AMP-binding protein [Nakamurella multipartita]ACV77115.1 AMP-dependent synthetase and ligase [Nakamurella multipartita DSM 44233]